MSEQGPPQGAVLKTLLPGQAIFSVPNPTLRRKIKLALESLAPYTEKSEPYCDYSLRLTQDGSTVAVKQFRSGALQIQGKDGPLFQGALAAICSSTKANIPSCAPRPGTGSSASSRETKSNGQSLSLPPEGYPYIGIDESGKGDYFGPLVIAAVCLDEEAAQQMASAGIRDSKAITDERCQTLANLIKKSLPGLYQIVEVSPRQYNILYQEFREENKNLNNLLAWGHSRALESLLENVQCQYAISDKFGSEGLIKSRLMSKGRNIRLIQEPRAERYAAVAAASILARDRFLSRLETIGQSVGTNLPKGASPAVIEVAQALVREKGKTVLSDIAKLHFKTTGHVLGRQ